MKSLMETWLVGVTSTVAAVALVSVVVMIRQLSVDVNGNGILIEQHWRTQTATNELFEAKLNQHEMRLNATHNRVTIVETNQTFYHGRL